MAKISNTTSYPTKGSPAGTDYVIGTDASSKEIKTFTLQSIANLYSGSGSGTVTSVALSGGTTGLTVTGSPVTSSGTITLAGTLATTNGGTGLTSIGTAGQVLKVNSGATGLEWGAGGAGTTYTAGDGLDLTGSEFSTDLKANGGLVIESTELAVDLGASSITGTLAVADGGTGVTTLTGVLKGNGTGAITGSSGIGDLSNVSFPASTNDASMYIGNGVPSGLSGTPTKNTAVGEGAGVATTTGSSNTLIGTNAGLSATTGQQNTLVGADAGDTITIGSSNIVIGQNADTAANNVNRSISIGSTATATTDGISIGYGASVTAAKGIALGRGAQATSNHIALGSATYNLHTTTDVDTLVTYLEVVVNGNTRYIPLYQGA